MPISKVKVIRYPQAIRESLNLSIIELYPLQIMNNAAKKCIYPHTSLTISQTQRLLGCVEQTRLRNIMVH